ncbi:MAG: hypothetical protein ACI3YB_03155, partial [Prevotella sp.]
MMQQVVDIILAGRQIGHYIKECGHRHTFVRNVQLGNGDRIVLLPAEIISFDLFFVDECVFVDSFLLGICLESGYVSGREPAEF